VTKASARLTPSPVIARSVSASFTRPHGIGTFRSRLIVTLPVTRKLKTQFFACSNPFFHSGLLTLKML
jgi:hypothetical protein